MFVKHVSIISFLIKKQAKKNLGKSGRGLGKSAPDLAETTQLVDGRV